MDDVLIVFLSQLLPGFREFLKALKIQDLVRVSAEHGAAASGASAHIEVPRWEKPS
jgi:hypothetical protein